MALSVYNVNVKANFIFEVDFNFIDERPLAFALLGPPDRLCANSEKLRYLRQWPQLFVPHSSHFNPLRSG
jgi:hypothetical protein